MNMGMSAIPCLRITRFMTDLSHLLAPLSPVEEHRNHVSGGYIMPRKNQGHQSNYPATHESSKVRSRHFFMLNVCVCPLFELEVTATSLPSFIDW